MMYHPELIVYLWLIPVILTLLLPLLAAPIIVMAERIMTAKKINENKIYVPLGGPPMPDGEKRIHPRIALDGVSAFISDGTNCCPGTVNDISPDGISLTNPHNVINKEVNRLGVLLNFNGKCFPIQVTPRWNEDTGREENIGAIITGGFWNWEEFTKNTTEPTRLLA